VPRQVGAGRPVLRSALQLLFWTLIGGIALIGYMALRIAAQGERDETRPADAIVVLGAAQFNGTPGSVFEARLQHAVDLWKQGLAPFLIVTGGKLPGDKTTEGATARKWAMDHGVPRSAILGEFEGRNTLESLEAVARIMHDNGLASALFVSDRTHMLRVLRMAADQGIVAWGSPTQTSPTDLDTARRRYSMVHEIAGLVAYYVGGGRLLDDAAIAGTR
jgi:uncharacterized SAM-binding protein YcdF (DUF218 family)